MNSIESLSERVRSWRIEKGQVSGQPILVTESRLVLAKFTLASTEGDRATVASAPDLLKALNETADQLEDLIEATEGLSGLDQFQKDALANSRVVLRVVARAAIAKAEGRA